jgi:hypothetical protein
VTAVSKTGGSFQKWGWFPKPVPVSKTGGGFQNWGEFWKVGGVSKTLLSGKNLKGRFLRLERLISLAGPAFLDFHPPLSVK